MLSDWLKTQKKPPRINQIKAVLIRTDFREKEGFDGKKPN